jgi:hypothetical protein
MAEWKFFDYQRPSTDADSKPILLNEILIWTRNLPQKAQARIDTLILVLSESPVWPPAYISGCGFPNIWEIRAGCFGVQYRPLGFHGPKAREFTLVIGTIEKGGKIPKGDGNSAVERRTRVLQGWSTCTHEFADSTAEQAKK